MKFKFWIRILLIGLSTVTAPAFAGDSDQVATTAIWSRHIQAWKARDVPGILKDYSTDAIVLVNGRPFKGHKAIGSLFGQLFALFGRAERHVIDPAVIQPGLIYLTWNARIDGLEHPVGTDTFVIRGRKIIYQTITADEAIFQPIVAWTGTDQAIVFKNRSDLKWEQMLPELGKDSPRFSILRVDPETKATTLMIEFPSAMHIPRHTHQKSETHIILGGSHLFERDGKRFDVKEHGYIYMPGGFVHEAWVPAGARAIIILEDGWKVDWVKESPGSGDIGKGPTSG